VRLGFFNVWAIMCEITYNKIRFGLQRIVVGFVIICVTGTFTGCGLKTGRVSGIDVFLGVTREGYTVKARGLTLPSGFFMSSLL
jgi:hypothetical protein